LWGLKQCYVWQLLTYEFMHAGPMHLLFNCWAIYVFGLDVEQTLGRARFLILYFASGIIGGLVQIIAGLALGGVFSAPVVGAGRRSAWWQPRALPDRVILLFILPCGAVPPAYPEGSWHGLGFRATGSNRTGPKLLMPHIAECSPISYALCHSQPEMRSSAVRG
jgi:hypothetical protein